MGCNLTKNAAEEIISEVVRKFSDNFKIKTAKRFTDTRLYKNLVLLVTVKKEDAKEEELFDALSSLLFNNEDITEIRSIAYEENKTLKEDYYISVRVKAERN